MWLNHNKYICSCTKQISWRKHLKVKRGAPKKQFFDTFCVPLWVPWRVFGSTVGSKLPSRPRNVTVQAHSDHA